MTATHPKTPSTAELDAERLADDTEPTHLGCTRRERELICWNLGRRSSDFEPVLGRHPNGMPKVDNSAWTRR